MTEATSDLLQTIASQDRWLAVATALPRLPNTPCRSSNCPNKPKFPGSAPAAHRPWWGKSTAPPSHWDVP